MSGSTSYFGNVTASDISFYLTIPGLFPVPQLIQGFSADEMFDSEDVEMAEIQQGVDNTMAAGWIPYLMTMRVQLRADSPSIVIFNTWQQAQNTARAVYPASGTLQVPAIGTVFDMQNGILARMQPLPPARKTLQPRPFTLTWGSVVVASTP